MSTITITGNLAADPELKFTPTGKAVARLRVIEDQPRKTGEGWQDGEPNVYRVQVWEGQAENLAESCARGDRVVVIGSVSTERWTDKESQEPRTAQYIKAREIGFSLRFHTIQATKSTRTSQTGATGSEQGE